MGQVIMPSVQGATSLEEVKNTVGIMIKELSWLLNNLDTRNVNEIDGDILVSGTVSADKVQANAITAEKIDVSELSAITANMGELTSGAIYGALIATSKTDYPRTELSSTEKMFAAYSAIGRGIKMGAFGGSGGSFLEFVDSGSSANVYYGGTSGLSMISGPGNYIVIGGTDIYLDVTNYIHVWDWADFKATNGGGTLQDTLDTKANVSESGYNLTFDPTTRNLKMWGKDSTLLAQVNIP